MPDISFDPTPTPETNSEPLFNRLMAEERAQKTSRLARLSQAVPVNPDRYNAQRQAAQQLGYAPAVVETLPGLEAEATVFRVENDIAGSPVLMRRYTDDDFAKLAWDDSSVLQKAANWFNGFKGGFVNNGSVGSELMDLNYLEMNTGSLTAAQKAKRDELEKRQRAWAEETQNMRSLPGGEGFPFYTGRTTGQSVYQMGESLLATGKGVAYGGAAGAGLGSVLPWVGTVGGATVGATLGGFMASGQHAYMQTSAEAWREFSNMTDVDGKRLDPELARWGARAVGTANALIEITSDVVALKVLKLVPGADKVIDAATGLGALKTSTKTLFRTALANPVLRSKMLNAIGKMAGGATLEGAEEFIQTMIAAAGREAVQAASGQTFKDDSFSQDLKEGVTAFTETTVGQFFSLLPAGGVNYVHMRNQANKQAEFVKAVEFADKVNNAFAIAAEAKLRTRSPEDLRATLQEMADEEEGAPKSIFIDAEVLAQAAQTMPSGELERILPSVVAQLPDALNAKTTVEVPIGEALTNLPGTELEQVFHQNMRSNPQAPSLAEHDAVVQQAEQFLLEQFEKVGQQAADQIAWQQSAEAVKTTIKQQLDAAGRFTPDVNDAYATLQQHFFSSMAARLGITPQEMYDRWSLKVGAQSQQTAETYQANGAPTKGRYGVTVEGRHFSREQRYALSSKMYGTGLKGDMRDKILNHGDKRLRDRIYFYVDKGTGINPERGVGGVQHKATLDNIYDLDSDPLRIWKGEDKFLDFESAVLDAGYSGYLARNNGSPASGVVIMLGDRNINVEQLGETDDPKSAPSVGAPAARPSYGRDVTVDAINANKKNFPMGAPTRARWAEILQKQMPEEHEALRAAGVFEGDPNRSLYLSELMAEFRARTEAPSYAQSLSSRLPGGKKATEDPLADTLAIGWDVALRDPGTLAKNIAAMQKYPNFPKLVGKGAKSVERNAEAILQHMVDNLLWLHDHMDADRRERARLWYDGGRKTVEVWADRYGITEMQGAAAIAVLSPRNGWFANVSQAERIADMVFGLRDFAWDDAMTAEAERISSEDGLDDKMKAAQGKTLGELLATPDIAARWIRVYDQTYNNRAYRVLTPEGGTADYVKTGKGTDATMMWKSYSTIAKAVSVLLDGRAENVHYQIGKEHKVRNFYNNIFAPDSELGYATIDTNAVSAALLRPLAVADTEVGQAFGGAGSSSTLSTGLNGTYPIYWEAYRRAAEARGLQPRQMQSITWEAVRGLFEAAQKKTMKGSANAIWERFRKSEITQAQAQQEILALAGDITAPSWTEVPFNETPSRTYEGPAQTIIDQRGPVGKPETPTARVMFEVAPDPNDAALTAEWNALSPEERLALSQQVAADLVPKVLKELGTGGDFVMQLGGYMGATNPSMTLRLERPELALTAAKLLGHALAQDSMMVVSENRVVGTDEVGAVTIKLPEGYGEAEVTALYDRLYEIQANGEPLVGGHTTADGQMVILNYSPLTTEDLAATIFNHLGAEFDVDTNVVYSAFPTKDNYGYGQTDAPSEGNTAARQSPAQERPDRLRSEATQQLRAALDARRAADGTATNRPLEQAAARDVTQTPEFQAWFGDSKVVDANGEPLVVYHGTNQKITAFDPAKIGARDAGFFGSGFYLTPDENQALDYADTAVEDTGDGEAVVMPLYVSLQNPFIWDMSDVGTDATRAALASFGIKRDSVRGNSASLGNANERELFNRAVRAAGYDGVLVRDEDGVQEVVAFTPTQIKSATGNNGNFDGSDANVLHQSAYHGSPHRFDKFLLDHIGTGEGAQAYGWGLYFAGAKEVAEWYREKLSIEEKYVDGELLDPYNPKHALANVLAEESQNVEEARNTLQVLAGPGGNKNVRKVAQDALRLLDEGLRPTVEFVKPDGQLYEVQIPEDDTMLLWDKPLSEQPEKVRAALESSGISIDDPVSKLKALMVERFGYSEADARIEVRRLGDRFHGDVPKYADPEIYALAREVYDQRMSSAPTGRNLYFRLQREQDSDEAASKYLNSIGVSGIKYLDGTSRSSGEGTYNYVIFDDAAVEILNTYYQGQKQGPLGTFNPQSMLMSLNENANFSTFLHESGHFFLEVLFGIASDPNGPQNVKDDMATVLKWFASIPADKLLENVKRDWQDAEAAAKTATGDEATRLRARAKSAKASYDFAVKNGGASYMKTVAETFGRDVPQEHRLNLIRQFHERWAEAFEQYVFEGKAPTAELQPIFRRFRQFLNRVYQSLVSFAKSRNLGVSDEIRQVMGRMLATDEQIAAAESISGMLPNEEATAEAIEKLDARSLRDLKWTLNAQGKYTRQLTKRAKELRAGIRDEVTAEVEQEPIYRAINFLRFGKLPEGKKLTNAQRKLIDSMAGHGTFKLSLPALKERYGEGPAAQWRYLSTGKTGLAATEGMHPDVLAELLEFESGDQLVRALVAAEPMASVIEGKTDQRMLERHGELATPEAIQEAAMDAVHNDARARALATELTTQDEAMNPRQQVGTDRNGRPITVNALIEAAKVFATNVADRTKIRDLNMKRATHLAAEVRASKRWSQATKKGDTRAAIEAKRDQLLNNMTVKALIEANDHINKVRDYLKKFSKEGTRSSINIDYRDQIDKLLERVDLRKVSGPEAAKRAKLAAWIASQEEMGIEVVLPESVLEDAKLDAFEDMTVDQAQSLYDAIRQIEHLGRLKDKLLTAKDQREFNAAKMEMIDSILENANGRTSDARTAATTKGKWLQNLKDFGAAHIKAATVARILDGGKDGGPVWKYLIRPANAAGDMETALRAQATEKLTAILAPFLSKKNMTTLVRYDAVGKSLTREQVLAIALNSGNAGNMQRLMGGEQWNRVQVQAILDTLTAEEAKAVQKVWDYFESLRLMIAELERRMFGKEPNWIDAQPLTINTADGQQITLRGGYFPIVYDPLGSERGNQLADAEGAKRMLQSAYSAATVRKSFTKDRAAEVNGMPLLLSLGGVYRGVNDVIHYLSWQEWLVDANRILRNKEIANAIRTTYGPEFFRQLKTWRDAAAEGDNAFYNEADKWVGKLRQSVSVAGLGFNVMSAMVQPLGFTNSIVRIGAKWVGRGISKYISGPVDATLYVTGKSSFMENRGRTRFRELNELRNRVEGQSGAKRTLNEYAYYLMMRTQQVVDVATWLGAYEKALTQTTDEGTAVALADQAVIDAQGGGQTKDLAAIERGGPAAKLFTVFYSFMNTALNLVTSSAMTRSKAEAAVDFLLVVALPAVLNKMLRDALTPGDAEDEEYWKALAKAAPAEVLSNTFGMFVGGREFIGAVRRVTDDSGYSPGYSGPVGVRVIADTERAIEQVSQGEFDAALRKSIVNLSGDVFGIPSAQINRSVTGLDAIVEGKTINPAALAFGYQEPR